MLTKFKARIESNLVDFSVLASKIPERLPLSREWLASETASAPNGPAKMLLEAAKISGSESATSWAVGLNRGAAAALRSYTESLVSWLYYKDHRIEFNLVQQLKSDLKLPKAVQSYLKEIDSGFEKSYQYLKAAMMRSNEYYYTNLSAFAHAHPNFVLHGKMLDEIVICIPPDNDFLEICSAIDEFISDQFAGHYRHSWGAIPHLVQQNLSSRLGNKLNDFLAVPD